MDLSANVKGKTIKDPPIFNITYNIYLTNSSFLWLLSGHQPEKKSFEILST